MQTYNYTQHEGHILADTGDQLWLLDTGAPMSVGNAPVILENTVYDVIDTYQGVSISDLNESIGVSFDVLLGMDIISRTGIYIDTTTKQVTFGEHLTAYDRRIPIDLVMGIPTVSINIGGTTQRLFFDTGAKITYLPASVVKGYRPVTKIRDFYPGFGPFNCDVYEIPADIGQKQVVIQVGVLPEEIERMLLATGTNGILGNSAWHGRQVHYSPANLSLCFDVAI
jgi:hypothetical protein